MIFFLESIKLLFPVYKTSQKTMLFNFLFILVLSETSLLSTIVGVTSIKCAVRQSHRKETTANYVLDSCLW